MTTWLPRSAWTTHPKPSGLVGMPSRPRGIAVHWPGTTTKIGHRTQANMAARLEGYRRFHVNGRGWSDIAYQVAVDQDGRVWELRGIEHQSAANGDQTVNREWLACLLLLGPGEHPTDDMRAAFTDWRERALKRYPTATRIVGHRDIRPGGGTDCPGPITEHLIKTDALLLEDDMPDAKEYAAETAKALAPLLDGLADKIAQRIVAQPLGRGLGPDDPGSIGVALYRIQSEAMRQSNLIAEAALMADSSVTDDPEGRTDHRANVVKLNVTRPWEK